MARTRHTTITRDERLAALQERHEQTRNFALDLKAMEARERDPDRLESLQGRRRDLEFQAARLEAEIANWTGHAR
jgi:hypothetical protein